VTGVLVKQLLEVDYVFPYLCRKVMIMFYFQVVRISSLTKEGIPELWTDMTKFKSSVQMAGEFTQKREKQHTIWMWNYIRDHIMDLFLKHGGVREIISEVEGRVASGDITPGKGADILLHKFVKEL